MKLFGSFAAVLSLLVFAGCSAPKPPDRALLGALEPKNQAGVPDDVPTPQVGNEARCPTAAPCPVRLGNSTRQAVLTMDGLAWKVRVRSLGESCLDFTLAGLGTQGATGMAVLEVAAAGGNRELYRTEVTAGEGWTRHRVELGTGRLEDDVLVLRSAGDQPVAWAEVYLTAPGPSPKPNLVLVCVDTLRADHLSCCGHPGRTSPHLDRLAGESRLFAASFSSSTWTLPSTASLLTGLVPDQHGLRSVDDVLSEEVETVAERLRRAGYRTAAFTDGGFLGSRWGFAQGFDRYDTTSGSAWDPKDAARIEASVSGWLRENRFSPYFLFIQTYETHQPYTDREGFSHLFRDPGYAGSLSLEVTAWQLDRSKCDWEDLRWATAIYDGEICRADHYLGRVLATLRRIGQFDDAAILVTSDHGEEFWDHGGIEHGRGRVFNENVRVPMIFKPPGGADGSVIGAPVSGIDVAPTLLAVAGIPPPAGGPGRSMLDFAAVEPEPRDILVHGLNSFPGLEEERYRLDRDWQSVVYDRVRGRTSRYDLEADPGMRDPLPPLPEGQSDRLLSRLQAVLGWLSPAGQYLVFLPAAASAVEIPPESSVRPVGLLDGMRRRPAEKGEVISLHAGRPHCLVYDLGQGLDQALVLCRDAGSGPLRPLYLTLPAEPPGPAAWTPLSGELPPPGAVLPVAARYAAASDRLREEDLAELEALGYIGE